MSTTETPAPVRTRLRFWIPTLYFAEGFPYSVVRQISSVFFKDNGASLQAVGLTSLFGLPWVLKFLWGPFLDEFSTKRSWLLAMEAVLVVILVFMAFGSALPQALAVVSGLFLFMAFTSATHDIGVDGYYLEALDRTEQARYSGFQAMSYRLALIAGGGGVVWLSARLGWWWAFLTAAVLLGGIGVFQFFALPHLETPRRPMSDLVRLLIRPKALTVLALLVGLKMGIRWLLGTPFWAGLESSAGPWAGKIGIPGFIAIGLLLALVGLAANVRRLRRRLYASDSFYARAFVDYLDQPRIGVTLAFIVLFRNGESFLLNMLYPFLRDIGVSREQYGVAYGTFGIAASIAGGLLGGFLISRYGLKKMIWPFAMAQNLLHFFYVFLALHYAPTARALVSLEKLQALSITLPQPLGSLIPFSFLSWVCSAGVPLRPDMGIVTLAVVIEALGAGMGTAVFMVFIMRTCKPRFKAANMAVASGIMNVGSALAGVCSGFLAEWMGFAAYFVFTFVISVPAMLLIPFLPYLDGSSAVDSHPAPEGEGA